MKVCSNCLLNDNMPSVFIGESGLCNYCERLMPARRVENADDEFAALLSGLRDRPYQVVMAYSGGKDSTYALKLLTEKYGASVLAVTFDNGFLSGDSLKNIYTVTDCLGVDCLIVKYPADSLIRAFKYANENRIFSAAALERASSICNLCITLVKNLIFREAIFRKIPVICFAWTPGQIDSQKPLIKLDHRMLTMMFAGVRNEVLKGEGREYAKYFLDSEFLEQHRSDMPYLFYPFVGNAYSEEKILESIGEIGWVSPNNTDGNSSNCLLNSYANQSHIERYGFHPYAFEISAMVRNGMMTRDEGERKLGNVKNDASFERVKKIFESADRKGGLGV